MSLINNYDENKDIKMKSFFGTNEAKQWWKDNVMTGKVRMVDISVNQSHIWYFYQEKSTPGKKKKTE